MDDKYRRSNLSRPQQQSIVYLQFYVTSIHRVHYFKCRSYVFKKDGEREHESLRRAHHRPTILYIYMHIRIGRIYALFSFRLRRISNRTNIYTSTCLYTYEPTVFYYLVGGGEPLYHRRYINIIVLITIIIIFSSRLYNHIGIVKPNDGGPRVY